MNAWRRPFRQLIRALGWDVVRYRPLWPTLLGIEQLPIRTVLDVGAYDGDTARIFRRIFPEADIYCVEPQPEPVQAIEAWAATQQGRVHVLPFALGSHNGTEELHRNPRLPRMASLAPSRPGHPNRLPEAITLTTPVMRLDDAVRAHIPLMDDLLIKIDVEGGERAVLAGGTETLRRCRACILEFHAQPIFDGGMSLTEACAVLGQLGLAYGGVLQQSLRRGRLSYFDAIFVNWPR